jgi:hypothetical protein
MLTFVKTLTASSSISRDVSLVPVRSRKPGYEHVPFMPSPLANHNGPNSYLYSTPDRPGLLSMIFVVVKVEMSAIARATRVRQARGRCNRWGKSLSGESEHLGPRRSFLKGDVRAMVVAGRGAGTAEFWMFTLDQGISPRCWKRNRGSDRSLQTSRSLR